jgi:hypothetical protein
VRFLLAGGGNACRVRVFTAFTLMMTSNSAPPAFASIHAHVSLLCDIDFWWPYIAEILVRHSLADAGLELVAGYNGSYPTFVYGDVVVKLFGYFRAWRESHAVEQAVLKLLLRPISSPSNFRPQISNETFSVVIEFSVWCPGHFLGKGNIFWGSGVWQRSPSKQPRRVKASSPLRNYRQLIWDRQTAAGRWAR